MMKLPDPDPFMAADLFFFALACLALAALFALGLL